MPRPPWQAAAARAASAGIDVHDLLYAADGIPPTLAELISRGRGEWDRVARLIKQALAGHPPPSASHRAGAVRWHAPTGRPVKNVVCLGLNYISHAKESAQARGREFKIPEAPVFFTKAPTSVSVSCCAWDEKSR